MKYHKRLSKLEKFVIENDLDALLITDVVDIFYLTGIRLSCGSLLIKNYDSTLFVDGRYFEAVSAQFNNCLKDKDLTRSLNGVVGIDSTKTTCHAFDKLGKQTKCSLKKNSRSPA